MTEQEAKKQIRDICQSCDVGIAIVALAWAVRNVYADIDKNRPDLSEFIRADFARVLAGEPNRKN